MSVAHLPVSRKTRRQDRDRGDVSRINVQPRDTRSRSRHREDESSHDDEESESAPRLPQVARKSSGQWDERYEELQDYRRQHGHCNVPFSHSERPLLGSWVKRQQYQYKCKMRGDHSHLTDERQAMLDEIGFVWDTHVGAWDEKFNELEASYRLHGHCKVPNENKELKVWCKRQRRQYNHYLVAGGDLATMTAERVECLNSIQFAWISGRSAASETSAEDTTGGTSIQDGASARPSRRRTG